MLEWNNSNTSGEKERFLTDGIGYTTAHMKIFEISDTILSEDDNEY